MCWCSRLSRIVREGVGRRTFPGMKWFEMDIPSGGTRRIRLDGTAGLKRVPGVRGN